MNGCLLVAAVALPLFAGSAAAAESWLHTTPRSAGSDLPLAPAGAAQPAERPDDHLPADRSGRALHSRLQRSAHLFDKREALPDHAGRRRARLEHPADRAQRRLTALGLAGQPYAERKHRVTLPDRRKRNTGGADPTMLQPDRRQPPRALLVPMHVTVVAGPF